MAETLLRYQHLVPGPNGAQYEARACGSPMQGGTWQAWIEFVPVDGGDAVRSRRETTRPNRVDTAYWATGVSPVYLEGALKRALAGPIEIPLEEIPPPLFSGPAPASTVPSQPGVAAVLDPFSVYVKGEDLLRRELNALSEWHLRNIVRAYALFDADTPEALLLTRAELAERIILAVRTAIEQPAERVAESS